MHRYLKLKTRFERPTYSGVAKGRRGGGGPPLAALLWGGSAVQAVLKQKWF